MSTTERIASGLVERQGWQRGTTLENRAMLLLHRCGVRPDDVEQEYRVGPYHLDFAWPDRKIALELDGWHHLRPESALRDVERDRALRLQGWLVFRVGDVPDPEMQHQIARVVQVVNALRGQRWETPVGVEPVREHPRGKSAQARRGAA